MLVASLLDVVRDQQHVGATSPQRLRHEPRRDPAKDRRAPFRLRSDIHRLMQVLSYSHRNLKLSGWSVLERRPD